MSFRNLVGQEGYVRVESKEVHFWNTPVYTYVKVKIIGRQEVLLPRGRMYRYLVEDYSNKTYEVLEEDIFQKI